MSQSLDPTAAGVDAEPPPRRPRGDSARARMIDVAGPLFAARGFDGVAVRELARAANVNVASVSYHFGGKRGLYLATLERLMEEMRPIGGPVIDRIDATFADGAPDRDALRSLATFMVGHFIASMHSGDLPPWVSQTVLREFQRPTPDYRPMLDERVLPLHRAVRRLVAAALELAPDSEEAVLAAHAAMGQIMVFAAARTVALEELDWPDFAAERLNPLTEAATAAVLRSLNLAESSEIR